MEETYLLNHPGVKKKILHGGQGPMPHFPPGTKLAFHFQTLKDDFERTVIDDSRKNKRPTEIFVGKMFKMEVWEVLLTSMRIGEVAEFWCDAIHTGLYPMVSKGMRLAAQGKDPLEGQQHTCGMGNLFHYHSMGSPELDELMKEPQPLIFIMELIEVGEPFSYKRDSWMMDKDEKLKAVPPLHLQGNMLVKQGRFHEASSCYQEAVLLLRTVQSREMPGDEDYINLGKLIIPLVLNYCQCMLEIEEYYEVIEHTTELLDKHKDCVKAYYKRAKAYAAVWDEKEARKNFLMVAKLDVTLSALVHRELRQLSERMKEKYWEDKEKYWNILEQKQESDKGQAEERENRETEDSSPRPADEEKNEERKENTDEAKGQEVPPFGEGPQAAANQRAAAVTEGKDWQQMLRLIMLLQDEGNFYVKEQRHSEAIEKFKEALQYVDHLQNKEVQYKGEDWESLEKVKLPLILNLSQCKMELGEYQEVVHLNSKVLKKHKRNVKAVYQRARAHAALCHEDEARRDFHTLTRLDPKFKPIVKQELKKLGEKVRTKLVHENKNYWTGSEEKWAKMAQAAKKDKQRKKEVKWADEGGEPVAAEPKPAGRQQTEEEEGEEGKRNVLDKKEESPPTGHQKERQEGEKNNTNEEGERMQDQMEVRSGTTEREEVKERDLAEGGGVQQSAKRTQRSKAKSKAKEVPPTAAPEQTDKNAATEQANEKAGRPSIPAESTNQGKEAEARAVVRDGMEEKHHRTTDAKAEEHKVHIPQDTEECVSGGKAQQPGPKTNAEASSATPDKSAKNPKRKNRKRK